MLIDNNVARASVNADTGLAWDIYRPVLFGRLERRKAPFISGTMEFRILHASADLRTRLKMTPVLAIAAETTVSGYNIQDES